MTATGQIAQINCLLAVVVLRLGKGWRACYFEEAKKRISRNNLVPAIENVRSTTAVSPTFNSQQ